MGKVQRAEIWVGLEEKPSMGKRGQQQGPPGLGQGRDKDAGWASTGWFMGNKRLCLKLGGMQESGEGKPSKVAGSIVEPLAC